MYVKNMTVGTVWGIGLMGASDKTEKGSSPEMLAMGEERRERI